MRTNQRPHQHGVNVTQSQLPSILHTQVGGQNPDFVQTMPSGVQLSPVS